jgi:hypothetical protein
VSRLCEEKMSTTEKNAALLERQHQDILSQKTKEKENAESRILQIQQEVEQLKLVINERDLKSIEETNKLKRELEEKDWGILLKLQF